MIVSHCGKVFFPACSGAQKCGPGGSAGAAIGSSADVGSVPATRGNGELQDLREGQEDVEGLLAVAGLLDVGDLAAAAIRDARLGDLGGFDRVVGFDVLGPHDAGDDQLADLEIDADLLFALDDEVAVRQDLRDDAGDVRDQLLLAPDRARAVAAAGRVRVQ